MLDHRSFDTVWKTCFELLLDPTVTEVEANGPNGFFMMRQGKRQAIEGLPKQDERSYQEGIERFLVPLLSTSESYSPEGYLFEGPLRYSSEGRGFQARTHIVLPPVVDHAQVTIAKRSQSLKTLEAIAASGSLAEEMRLFLEACIRARLTMVFSGSSGSGKTTLLEACSKLIDPHLRIGVAEDAPELNLVQPNVTYLHSVPAKPGQDPHKVAKLEWLVAQFNRMRCDMVIIGETRDREFGGFLQGANSGMEGSLTTVHANDTAGALKRMAGFALKAAENMPLRAVNSAVAEAVDIIVQLQKFSDGRYRVTEISHVPGVVGSDEDALITSSLLYKYHPAEDYFSKEGTLAHDNLRRRFARAGVSLDPFFVRKPGDRLPLTAAVQAPSPDGPRLSGGGLPLRPGAQGRQL